MQKLTLIRGWSGSGKSTLAKQLLDASTVPTNWLEADFYFSMSGKYQFHPHLLPSAHQWCQDTARISLQRGLDVIVSNTFIRTWELQPYLDMAKSFNVEVEIIVCTGEYQNTHGLTEEKVQKQKDRFEELP